MKGRFESAVLVAVVLSIAACGLLPPDYTVHVSNGTTVPVTVVVNGTQVGTVDPNSRHDFTPSGLPAMPWTVEARLASGRPLATMRVERDSIQDHRALDGTGEYSSVDDLEILSCGQLWMWVGEKSSGGPVREGKPGDCDP